MYLIVKFYPAVKLLWRQGWCILSFSPFILTKRLCWTFKTVTAVVLPQRYFQLYEMSFLVTTDSVTDTQCFLQLASSIQANKLFQEKWTSLTTATFKGTFFFGGGTLSTASAKRHKRKQTDKTSRVENGRTIFMPISQNQSELKAVARWYEWKKKTNAYNAYANWKNNQYDQRTALNLRAWWSDMK